MYGPIPPRVPRNSSGCTDNLPSVAQRGGTLDVLNIVRRLCEAGTARCAVRAPSGRKIPAALPPGTSQPVLRSITAEGGRDVPANTFTAAEVCAFERELEKLQPGAKEGNQGNKGLKQVASDG